MHRKQALLVFALFMLGCASNSEYTSLVESVEELTPATIQDAPQILPAGNDDAMRPIIDRGEYLVELLGCGTCHTDGALIGEPNPARFLAGSRTGVAYSSPLLTPRPGVVFPPNITSDVATGIGGWTEQQLYDAIRAGAGRHSPSRLFVMPWPGYARLAEDDARAIVAYLQNLPAIEHRVPARVLPGSTTAEPYVYFGVYRSRQ